MSITTLNSKETPLGGLQRLTREQMAEILAAAATTAGDRAHRIHLGCKRIRSYLRLMREALGEERYGYENVYFRNLARPFKAHAAASPAMPAPMIRTFAMASLS